ncbi:MAG: Lipid-A-disaccharide synthase (EC [uncultured Sulfurovum sp.]|uniref:Lipid-A-disaccharide synthase n=1 Tax=uncultured Sulfurovum sp. TaxID=269237 RepID=A0A6S6TIH3_9BACT|nr:MAG: Lipid-A-disaccharide synthase (EC [uncultured Sulfurovum sp.]
MAKIKILVSALEPSSNLHLKEVLKHTDNLELLGIFDKSLGTPLYDISEMAIMGVVDAIKKLRWFFKVANEMVELAKGADKILLMDASGFNLPLAKKLKKAYPHKEIIYYILPQIWASRPKRAIKLEKYCDKLLGILPFEVNYYKSKAQYVGHPLLDEIKINTSTNNKEYIAFMPGSRKSEISKLLPIFKEVRQNLAHKKAILIVPKTFSDEKIEVLYGDTSTFILERDTHLALSKSEFAFICSGTATLEAALIGTPFTLAYIAKKMDFFIGTKLLGIKQVGLANIILTNYNNSTLHNELLQENVNIENLLKEYAQTDRTIFTQKAKELTKYLAHGSSKNVAKLLESF